MSIRSSQFIQPQTCVACVYKDDDYFKDLIPLPPLAQQPRHRHLEISSTEHNLDGLEGIMEITESLSVKDNNKLRALTDLHPKVPRLMDVVVERCQEMFAIFYHNDRENIANELLNIRVGHLPQLTTLIGRGLYHDKYGASFVVLKHLHVYNCGELKRIFPNELVLHSLQTLTITYCDKLQTVFYNSWRTLDYVIKYQLQHLRNIWLEELPQLRDIYEVQEEKGLLQVRQWETLYFRGCWSLCQLPLLQGPRDQQVCVNGEAGQCKKIKAHMKAEQLSHYEFKSPPPVASLKDCVKNKIFLK